MTEPIRGEALKLALESQEPTRRASPTGEPYVPPRMVPALMALYTALSGLAGYLALFEADPTAKKVGFGIGLALAVLGPLLGMATPGWRRGGTTLALLAVTLSASAWAAPVRRAVLFETEAGRHVGLVAAGEEEPMSPASVFAIGAGLGINIQGGKVTPMAEMLGTLGLLRLGGGVLSLAAGGSLFLGESARPGALLGLTYDLPGIKGDSRPYLGIGAGYAAEGWSGALFVGMANLLL